MQENSDSSRADKRLKALIHRVFITGAGAELLEEWKRTYIEQQTFAPDPITMARNAAQKDFVSNIVSIIREVSSWK